MTEASGTALVFDEVVTGFRSHPGGAQALFGVRADLATYGKVIGGGLPIGLVAGRREYMDALDGGAWQYGDDSIPEVGVTFFAGTFVRHPLALAAARAVLDQLEEQGPELQRDLNLRTTAFAARLECPRAKRRRAGAHRPLQLLALRQLPDGRAARRALLRDDARPRRPRLGGALLVPHDGAHGRRPRARLRGVPGHDRRDAGRRSPARRRRAAGSGSAAAATTPKVARPGSCPIRSARASTCKSRRLQQPWLTATRTAAGRLRPVRAGVGREVRLAAHRAAGRDVDRRGHEPRGQLLVQPVLRVHVPGPVAGRVLARRARSGRCSARRACAPSSRRTAPARRCGRRSPSRCRSPTCRTSIPTAREREIERLLEQRVRDAVRPRRGPAGPRVRRARVRGAAPFRPHRASHRVRRVVVGRPLLGPRAALRGRLRRYPGAARPRRVLRGVRRRTDEPATRSRRPLRTRSTGPRSIPTERRSSTCPLTGARPPTKTYRSGREDLRIDDELYAAIKQTGARSGGTLFATLLAAYEALVYRLSGQSDFVVGIPFAGQPQLENSDARRALRQHRSVASAPRPGTPRSPSTFALSATSSPKPRTTRDITFGSLVRRLQLPRDPSRTPLVSMTFSIDKIGAPFDFGDVTIASLATPKSYSNFELQVNVVDSGSDLRGRVRLQRGSLRWVDASPLALALRNLAAWRRGPTG